MKKIIILLLVYSIVLLGTPTEEIKSLISHKAHTSLIKEVLDAHIFSAHQYYEILTVCQNNKAISAIIVHRLIDSNALQTVLEIAIKNGNESIKQLIENEIKKLKKKTPAATIARLVHDESFSLEELKKLTSEYTYKGKRIPHNSAFKKLKNYIEVHDLTNREYYDLLNHAAIHLKMRIVHVILKKIGTTINQILKIAIENNNQLLIKMLKEELGEKSSHISENHHPKEAATESARYNIQQMPLGIPYTNEESQFRREPPAIRQGVNIHHQLEEAILTPVLPEPIAFIQKLLEAGANPLALSQLHNVTLLELARYLADHNANPFARKIYTMLEKNGLSQSQLLNDLLIGAIQNGDFRKVQELLDVYRLNADSIHLEDGTTAHELAKKLKDNSPGHALIFKMISPTD